MASSGRPQPAGRAPAEPFWRTKTLAEMNEAEWESLCDGCGRCCLNKLEDADTGEIFFTDVACRLFDAGACRCTDYLNRHDRVADCIPLTAENAGELTWLPPTCGYRLLAEGRDLYWWHPLVSGDPRSVHEAGISVRGRVLSETDVPESELENYVVKWPGEIPGRRFAPALRRNRRTRGRSK